MSISLEKLGEREMALLLFVEEGGQVIVHFLHFRGSLSITSRGSYERVMVLLLFVVESGQVRLLSSFWWFVIHYF